MRTSLPRLATVAALLSSLTIAPAAMAQTPVPGQSPEQARAQFQFQQKVETQVQAQVTGQTPAQSEAQAQAQAQAEAKARSSTFFYDTLTLLAGVSVQHNSNLFLLPSGIDTNAVLGTSSRDDTLTTASVGFKLDKQYSLQRFELGATVENNRYKNFDFLDFTAFNYDAAWRWSLTPALHGNLTSDRKQALNSYADFNVASPLNRTRNVRTDENHRLDAVYEVSGGWRILGGIMQVTRHNSSVFVQESDTRINSAEGGFGYDFKSGSSLAFVTRSGHGEYVKVDDPIAVAQIDTGFDQRENEAHLYWPITGKTIVDARLAHIERNHDHFSDRDYSGNVGGVNLNWSITEKTSLLAGVSRDLTSYQSASSSFISSDRLSLIPSWQISAKTTLRGRYDYARRSYEGAIAVTPVNGREDHLQTGLLAVDWLPMRSLTLTASVQNDRRTSNRANFDYRSTTVGVQAQLAF